MALTRITVTVPASVARQADRYARREGRSRSWVVSEALRRLVAELPATSVAPAVDRGTSAEFAAVRTAHLSAESSLPPAERLARAEELGALGRERQARGRREQVLAFDSYDDFYRWKAARLIGA